MSYLKRCDYLYDGEYEPKYTKFDFELDHFQKYACEGIDNDENVFITAHTGSGKTVPAEYAIYKALATGNKVVYISPIKALSNQKYNDFKKKWDDIGIMTGDNKINPEASLIIMTAEIFRNSLYRSNWDVSTPENHFNFEPSKVKYVILDEIHYINDIDRGKVWEEILMLLPKDTHLTMLSATIDKPEVLAGWIGNYQKKKTRLISTLKRPVPLKFYLLDMDKKYLLLGDKWDGDVLDNFNIKKNKFYKTYSKIHIINNSINLLEKQGKLPCIYFVLSKKIIDEYSKKIVGNFLNSEELFQVKKIWDDYLIKYRHDFTTSTQFVELYELLKRGIGFHHSGLIPILKEIVEILYSKKLVKVLLATETFAVGVNMPTKTVVFPGVGKRDNICKRLLRNDEFLQMAGRAGRRGIDSYGEVIILPIYLPNEKELKEMILGSPISLESKLQFDISWILKHIYYYNVSKSEKSIIDFLINQATKSFCERNSTNILINLEKKKSDLEDIINENYKKIPTNFKKDYFDILKEFESCKNKKKRKILHNKLESYRNHSDFKILTNIIKMEKDFSIVEESIIFEKNKFENHFSSIIQYLEFEELIKSNILTPFGLLTISINEINPLIISYMIYNKYLDKMTFPQLVAFISMFIEIKNNDIGLSQVEMIDESQYEILEIANDTMNYYYDNELKLNETLPFTLKTDYDITLENYDVCYLWADGKDWKDIKSIYKNFEGNFSKLILRIHNILKEIVILFEIMGNNEMVIMIKEKQDSLIREIVQMESLYLRV